MSGEKTYSDKRSFDVTSEPASDVEANVDLAVAAPGTSFVIHQHHARRLHFDLRLEMMHGDTPVYVSWAIPKNLPRAKGKPHLAVHVEDHPFAYGSFSGTIPAGQYGAGEVRIFDSGTYELLEQAPGKLSFRLRGHRLQGVYHLTSTRSTSDKDEWLAFLKADERGAPEDHPPIAPMLASSTTEPFDDESWLFEPKWDGVRAVAVCSNETMLVSRNQRDITAAYPELERLHERMVALDTMLDGEIVAMEGGRPSFEKLQSRINLHDPNEIVRASKSSPVVYIAFDVLYLDGRSTVTDPLERRKELLEGLVVPGDMVQVTPSVAGEGLALAAASRAQNLEGIVAKKLGSPYRPGRRSTEWLKVKTVFDADVVIGGWTRGEGGRSDTFGALLVGAYEDDELRFAGAVGTGFNQRSLSQVTARLNELETASSPFAQDPTGLKAGPFGKAVKGARWIRPELVARVEFRELTAAGRLRAPSFKALRTDKSPRDCLLSELAAPQE